MSSTDDTTLISPMVVVSDCSQDPFDNTSISSEDERVSMILDTNVENDQDEGINGEHESDNECELTPTALLVSINNHISVANSTLSKSDFNLNPLLEGDINDVF